MGKKIIPPQDQERLARIMNEKERMIGVEVDQLQRQAQERQERKAAEAKAKEQTEAQQLLWAQEADRLQADVDVSRRRNAEKVAAFVKDQAEKKKGRDEVLREVYRNRVDDRYFNQFGTSHR